MFSRLLIVLPAVIAGVAATESYCESKTTCIDAVKDCGVKYGGYEVSPSELTRSTAGEC